jgi:aryl-phospho-beta-D-glucosidase BglC (GH1 family)
MSSTLRTIYKDQAITLQRDTTSSMTAAGLTASNFVYCGASNWTLTLASGTTAASNLTVQTNSSNLIAASITGLDWNGNPVSGLMQTKYNPSFTANWVDLAVLSSGYNLISITNIPCRYIRLSGVALSNTGCYAFLWTETML